MVESGLVLHARRGRNPGGQRDLLNGQAQAGLASFLAAGAMREPEAGRWRAAAEDGFPGAVQRLGDQAEARLAPHGQGQPALELVLAQELAARREGVHQLRPFVEEASEFGGRIREAIGCPGRALVRPGLVEDFLRANGRGYELGDQLVEIVKHARDCGALTGHFVGRHEDGAPPKRPRQETGLDPVGAAFLQCGRLG